MRALVLTLAVLLLSPATGAAEWQLKPFLGVAFGGSTTLIDLADAAGGPNIAVGVTGALLGNIFGLDVDFSHAPGFFSQGGQHLVLSSSATTLTCNLVLAPPRRVTEYALGPYFVVGGGMMHASIDDFGSVFAVSRTFPAMDVGGGANGYLSDRFGLNWDARYFWSVSRKQARGVSFGTEQLSFWRASMALVIRRR
jgi:hypothetical protein